MLFAERFTSLAPSSYSEAGGIGNLIPELFINTSDSSPGTRALFRLALGQFSHHCNSQCHCEKNRDVPIREKAEGNVFL